MAKPQNVIVVRDEGAAERAVALPKSGLKADPNLVERAMSHIREVLSTTVTRGIEQVGRYLLETFYDGDPRLYFSANPNKHASLRLLMERCESMECPVSRTFLANALRMAAVMKELPRPETFQRLPPSHRIELLRLKGPDKLERLASKAVSEKLTILKLRALIQKESARDGAPSRGRRRNPGVLRAIDACLRALRDEQTGRLLFRRSDIGDMTAEQLARAHTALGSLEKRVAELRRLIG